MQLQVELGDEPAEGRGDLPFLGQRGHGICHLLLQLRVLVGQGLGEGWRVLLHPCSGLELLDKVPVGAVDDVSAQAGLTQ